MAGGASLFVKQELDAQGSQCAELASGSVPAEMHGTHLVHELVGSFEAHAIFELSEHAERTTVSHN